MAYGDPFLPRGNGVAINASTTSNGVQVPTPNCSMVVTNRSTTSPAWVTWNQNALPTAAFPIPGDTTGTFGMEVAPGAQVSISVNGTNNYVAVVLLSGTGVVSVVSGTGV